MATVEIPGGTAEIREKLNVGRMNRLRAESAEYFTIMREKYQGNPADYGKPITGTDDERTAKALELMRNTRHDAEYTIAGQKFQTVAIVALTESWTRPEPLPQTVAEWEEFDDEEVYQALALKLSPRAYALISGTALVVSNDAARDPETPTEPLSASNGEGLEQEAIIPLTTPLDGLAPSTTSTDLED